MTDTPSLDPSRFPALRAAARKPQTFDNARKGPLKMSVSDVWQLICPDCEDDGALDIAATVWIRLFENGTDADAAQDGNHEWDQKSKCQCASCGWSGTVADAEEAYEKP